MKTMNSGIVGLCVAALIPALVAGIRFQIGDFLDPLNTVVSTIFFYPISLGICALLGGGSLYLASRMKIINVVSAVVFGFCTGGLVPVLIALPFLPTQSNFAAGACSGGSAAVVFWVIWNAGGSRKLSGK